MKILFFYQHFWPDSPPDANMLRVLGTGLFEKDKQVNVLTAQPSYKTSDREIKRASREELDGISVTRLTSIPGANYLKPVRQFAKMIFPIRAFLHIVLHRLFGSRSDVIVATTIPPVINGFFGLLSARVSGARFVYHMQDIYPEIGVTGGLWREKSWRHKFLLKLDAMTASCADRCVVLSSDMRSALLNRGLHADRIFIINNFPHPKFDDELSHKADNEQNVASVNLGGDARYKVIFAGNLGRFQGLDTLLLGFLSLDFDRFDFDLHFLGEGAMSDQLKQLAGRNSRVFFHGHVCYAKARLLIGACDAGIVSVRQGVYKYAYPSKTLSYFDLGLPVLAVVEQESELASDIEEHRLGIVASSRDIEGIRNSFEGLADYLKESQVSITNLLGEYTSKNTTAGIALEKWNYMLEGLLDGSASQPKRD